MPSSHTLLTFLAVTGAVMVVPGPTVTFAVTTTLRHGTRAGLWTVLGLECGLLAHAVAAALGVAGVVASSPTALVALKVGGGAYLGWLGAVELVRRGAPSSASAAGATTPSAARLVRSGFLVDVLNPKTVLFLLALLPQFVDPSAGSGRTQALVLGVLAVAVAVVVDAGYTVAAGVARHRSSATRWPEPARTVARDVPGLVLLGLAVVTVT